MKGCVNGYEVFKQSCLQEMIDYKSLTHQRTDQNNHLFIAKVKKNNKFLKPQDIQCKLFLIEYNKVQMFLSYIYNLIINSSKFLNIFVSKQQNNIEVALIEQIENSLNLQDFINKNGFLSEQQMINLIDDICHNLKYLKTQSNYYEIINQNSIIIKEKNKNKIKFKLNQFQYIEINANTNLSILSPELREKNQQNNIEKFNKSNRLYSFAFLLVIINLQIEESEEFIRKSNYQIEQTILSKFKDLKLFKQNKKKFKNNIEDYLKQAVKNSNFSNLFRDFWIQLLKRMLSFNLKKRLKISQILNSISTKILIIDKPFHLDNDILLNKISKKIQKITFDQQIIHLKKQMLNKIIISKTELSKSNGNNQQVNDSLDFIKKILQQEVGINKQELFLKKNFLSQYQYLKYQKYRKDLDKIKQKSQIDAQQIQVTQITKEIYCNNQMYQFLMINKLTRMFFNSKNKQLKINFKQTRKYLKPQEIECFILNETFSIYICKFNLPKQIQLTHNDILILNIDKTGVLLDTFSYDLIFSNRQFTSIFNLIQFQNLPSGFLKIDNNQIPFAIYLNIINPNEVFKQVDYCQMWKNIIDYSLFHQQNFEIYYPLIEQYQDLMIQHLLEIEVSIFDKYKKLPKILEFLQFPTQIKFVVDSNEKEVLSIFNNYTKNKLFSINEKLMHSIFKLEKFNIKQNISKFFQKHQNSKQKQVYFQLLVGDLQFNNDQSIKEDKKQILEISGEDYQVEKAMIQIQNEIDKNFVNHSISLQQKPSKQFLQYLNSLSKKQIAFSLEDNKQQFIVQLYGFNQSINKIRNNVVEMSKINLFDISELSFPKYWANMQGKEYIEIKVDPISREYLDILEHFQKSMPNIKDLQAMRIQNLELWKNYQFQKLKLRKLKNVANEMLLFHGTNLINPEFICKSKEVGFDLRNQNQANQACNGIFFSEQSNEASKQGFDLGNGRQQLLYALVFVGHIFKEKLNLNLNAYQSIKKLPKIPGKNYMYDSQNDNASYLIFNSMQAYPLYLLEYNKIN